MILAGLCLLMCLLVIPARADIHRADVDGNGRLEAIMPSLESMDGYVVVPDDVKSVSPINIPGLKLRLCDWNADDRTDILVLREGTSVSLFLNRGNGAFEKNDKFSANVSLPLRTLTVADLTNAPWPGIVGRLDSASIVLIERPTENDHQFSYWAEPSRAPISLRDVDGDGRVDVVVGDQVRLRQDGKWSDAWIGIDEVRKVRHTQLVLRGPEGNPLAIGTRIEIPSPAGVRRIWIYPEEEQRETSFDLVIAGISTGVVVRWPDGRTDVLPPGLGDTRRIVLGAAPPMISGTAMWENENGDTHLRWQISRTVESDARGLWRVVCSGKITDPQPVSFDGSLTVMEWNSGRRLHTGETCVLMRAGVPVSVRTVPIPGPGVLSVVVLRDTTTGAGTNLLIADGNGDGRPDLLAMEDTLQITGFSLSPTSNTIAAPTRSAVFDPQRPGHRAWWRAIWDTRNESPFKPEWVDAQPDFSGQRVFSAEVTGDSRGDVLTLRDDGTISIYQATDGRPSGMHICAVCPGITPAGPGDTLLIHIVNPSQAPLSLSNIELPPALSIVSNPLPITVGPGDTCIITARLQPGTHADINGSVRIVGTGLDGGSASIPMTIRIGVPASHPEALIEVPLGAVQRDSVIVVRVRLPWVQLPPGYSDPWSTAHGDAHATAFLADTRVDTIDIRFEFVALALGDLKVSFPLRKGTLTLSAEAVDTIAPPAVKPTISLASDSVIVRWSPVEAADLRHYGVRRITDFRESVFTTEDTVFIDTGLAEGITRWYVVESVDVTGNTAVSDTMHITRVDGTPPVVRVRTPIDTLDIHPLQVLRLEISDSLSGLNPDSLSLWVNSVPVSATEFAREDGNRRWVISYLRAGGWDLGERVSVAIVATDLSDSANTLRWHASFTVVADTVMPVMRWKGDPPLLGVANTLHADVEIAKGREILKASLVVRQAGETHVDTLTGTVSGKTIEIDVPPSLSSASGFFYRWTVTTNYRRYDLPESNPTLWYSWSFRVSGANLYWPRSGMRGRGRSLVAPPVQASSGGAFDAFLEEAKSADVLSRVFGYDPVEQKWVATDDMKPATPGDAIFVRWDESAPVVQIAPGTTVTLDSAHTITLHPGWNLVGQPYPYPVSWKAIRKHNTGLRLGSPWVEREALQLTDVWNPWEGAWVFYGGNTPTELTIVPADTTVRPEVVPPGKTPLPTWLDASILKDTDFLLRITATTEGRTVTDVAVGWHRNARDEYDVLDIPQPPSPDSMLIVRFKHPDWSSGAGDYAVDMRRSAGGSVWKMEAISYSGESADLTLEWIVPPPAGVAVDLLDLMAPDSIRLPNSGSVTYRLSQPSRFPVRELAIVAGDETYRGQAAKKEALAPSELHLFPASPNPFNSRTSISYSIPSSTTDAPDQRLRLVIYNMLGQHVRLLQEGYVSPGTHTKVWNARDDSGNTVSSGLYFVEMTYGAERKLQRLIYLR
jgi:hypothetical protein